MPDDWRPAATLKILEERARMLQDIRAFFLQRGVLEVETPALSSAAISDPAIYSIEAMLGSERLFLHSSPEFPMKRLLAAGSGDIFQICKVFRAGESGRYHNPEFSLLEWYRQEFDDDRLADEVVDLIRHLSPPGLLTEPERKISYQSLFEEGLGIDPLDISINKLEVRARQEAVHPGCSLLRDAWLDLLLSHCLISSFPLDRLTIVHDYPATQAALARINPDGLTAARFEIFWGPLELANGFYELTDAMEQRRRFESELQTRRDEGLPLIPMDENLLSALQEGLPDCAGVALGLDRLLMRVAGVEHIDEVLAFPLRRA